MKRLLVLSLFISSLFLAMPVLASEDTVITLDDASPSVDVVITLPLDTTGTIAINMSMAAVTLKDESGNIVFHAADERLHALELNIAPNTGQHTLTVERLPGVTTAYVSIKGVDSLTINGQSSPVNTSPISYNQTSSLALDSSNPNGTVNVSIPADNTGVVTASFVGANATTQFVDSNGVVVAYSFAGHIDGLSLLVDGGDYSMNILGSGLNASIGASVRVMPTNEAGFMLMDIPQTAEQTTSTSDANTCTATILVSSVNLRSGPGTGYSVLQYGYNGDTYPVGGQNTDGSWVVIGTNDSSAWISSNTAQFNGNCNALTVFNVPYREAQVPQIILSTPEPQIVVVPAASSNNSAGNSGGEHEGGHDHNDD